MEPPSPLTNSFPGRKSLGSGSSRSPPSPPDLDAGGLSRPNAGAEGLLFATPAAPLSSRAKKATTTRMHRLPEQPTEWPPVMKQERSAAHVPRTFRISSAPREMQFSADEALAGTAVEPYYVSIDTYLKAGHQKNNHCGPRFGRAARAAVATAAVACTVPGEYGWEHLYAIGKRPNHFYTPRAPCQRQSNYESCAPPGHSTTTSDETLVKKRSCTIPHAPRFLDEISEKRKREEESRRKAWEKKRLEANEMAKFAAKTPINSEDEEWPTGNATQALPPPAASRNGKRLVPPAAVTVVEQRWGPRPPALAAAESTAAAPGHRRQSDGGPASLKLFSVAELDQGVRGHLGAPVFSSCAGRQYNPELREASKTAGPGAYRIPSTFAREPLVRSHRGLAFMKLL